MTTALQIPALAKLHQAGFNPLVLRAIEDNAMMQAVEMRLMGGFAAHSTEDVVRTASDLQPFSEHLGRVAEDLEFAGARLLAANKGGITVERFAQAQQTLSERYADIIDAAQQIEKAGGPAPFHQLSLLTERPEGPLEAFYDKAQALLQSRQSARAEHRLLDSPH